MKELFFKVEYDEDGLGKGWFNIFNLELCLFSENHTNRNLVKVTELPEQESEFCGCEEPFYSAFKVYCRRCHKSIKLKEESKKLEKTNFDGLAIPDNDALFNNIIMPLKKKQDEIIDKINETY